MSERKPILCLDFDGVVHSYTSGWKGAAEIPDPPVPGALEFIVRALDRFEVHIFSSRSNLPGARRAMQEWLLRHLCEIAPDYDQTPDWWRDRIARTAFADPWPDEAKHAAYRVVYAEVFWPSEKPPAFVTIDDRAIQFNGTWPSLDELANFKPWYKRENTATEAAAPGLTARDLARDQAFQEALERYAKDHGSAETVAWCALRAIERAVQRKGQAA